MMVEMTRPLMERVVEMIMVITRWAIMFWVAMRRPNWRETNTAGQ